MKKGVRTKDGNIGLGRYDEERKGGRKGEERERTTSRILNGTPVSRGIEAN
jgi:hypothetical protein